MPELISLDARLGISGSFMELNQTSEKKNAKLHRLFADLMLSVVITRSFLIMGKSSIVSQELNHDLRIGLSGES